MINPDELRLGNFIYRGIGHSPGRMIDRVTPENIDEIRQKPGFFHPILLYRKGDSDKDGLPKITFEELGFEGDELPTNDINVKRTRYSFGSNLSGVFDGREFKLEKLTTANGGDIILQYVHEVQNRLKGTDAE